MPTIEQLKAIFAEWERRARAGNWKKNRRTPEASALVFAEIAGDLFPELKREPD